MKFPVGEGKKARNFGAPHPSGPQPFGPPLFLGSGPNLFLHTNTENNVVQVTEKRKRHGTGAASQHPSLEVVGVPQHHVQGRRGTIHSSGTVTVKEGESKSLSSGTCQNRAPPPHPCCVRSALQGLWHVLHFSDAEPRRN